MKVDELEGIELDYHVARAEGVNISMDDWVRRELDYGSWSFIGPIVERDGINLTTRKLVWRTSYPDSIEGAGCFAEDNDVSTAVKRCIVKHKFGEEVAPESARAGQ